MKKILIVKSLSLLFVVICLSLSIIDDYRAHEAKYKNDNLYNVSNATQLRFKYGYPITGLFIAFDISRAQIRDDHISIIVKDNLIFTRSNYTLLLASIRTLLVAAITIPCLIMAAKGTCTYFYKVMP